MASVAITMCGAAAADLGGHGCARFDDADHRNPRYLGDLRQRQSGRSVAGNDQQVDVLGFEKSCRANCVARHGISRLGAIGQAGGISEIEIVSSQLPRHGSEHREPTNSGVENSNARKRHWASFMIWPMPLAR